MYSVLRIMAEEPQRALLQTLVTQANANHPASFDAPHNRRGGPWRTSCSIAEAAEFSAHMAALAERLTQFAETIQLARDAGCSLVFDLALDGADLKGKALHEINLDVALLQWLTQAGVAFELTIYADDEADGPGDADDDITTDPEVAVTA